MAQIHIFIKMGIPFGWDYFAMNGNKIADLKIWANLLLYFSLSYQDLNINSMLRVCFRHHVYLIHQSTKIFMLVNLDILPQVRKHFFMYPRLKVVLPFKKHLHLMKTALFCSSLASLNRQQTYQACRAMYQKLYKGRISLNVYAVTNKVQ